MVYGILSSFNNVGYGEFFYLLGAAFACVGVLGAWMGADDPEGKEETEERVNSAARFVSDIVSFVVSKRKEATTTDEAPLNADDEDKDAQPPQKGVVVNQGRYWRDDYWNFENSIESDLFAAEQEKKNEEEQWRESLDEKDEREKRDTTDEEERETERPQGRANYFGSFFRSRRYPSDVFEENERDDDLDAPKRWRKNKKNERREDDALDNADAPMSVPESADATADVNAASVLTDEELDRLFNGAIDDEQDDEFEPAENENELEPDYDYLDDESVDLDEKIAYLRKRMDPDDIESTSTLVQMLVQRAAMANKDEEKIAMDALDEVEKILDEFEAGNELGDGFDGDSYDFDVETLRAQALLQRPFYFLRNGKEPPMALAKAALSRIKKWANETETDEARRMLATAWQVHGISLMASGAESAGLSSLLESRRIFQELVESGVEEARPSIGVVCLEIGDAYHAIGDNERAAKYYRESLETFEAFSAQEGFLSEKVNAGFRLSIALRNLGKTEEADAVLEEAIEGEERLLSYNEETYFAPLSMLLEAQADAFAMRGQTQEALAALDRAISTLENFLSYDSPISRRVLAYARLENALRRRATVFLGQRRFAFAARDICKAAEYIGLAAKKDPEFDPIAQTTIVACLLSDLCAFLGLWPVYERVDAELQRMFDSMEPDDLRLIVPIYGQLLMQRRNILMAVDKRKDAGAVSDKAIKLLEDAYKEDDSNVAVRLVLAKALAQRGFVKLDKKRAAFVSIPDLRRSKMLLEDGLENDQLDEQTTKILIELLEEKAFAEAKGGARDVAREDMRLAVKTVWGKLRAKQWDYIEQLAALSRVSMKLAADSTDSVYALRIARLWLRYIERLRRNYVETSWEVDAQGDDSGDNKKFLQRVEAFLIDVKNMRCSYLEGRDWEPRFERYYDLRALKETIANAKERDAKSAKQDTVDQRLMRFTRVVAGAGYEAERERFICEHLEADPKALATFADLDSSIRVFRRRFAEGEYGFSIFLVLLTDKLAQFVREFDDLPFELANAAESARILNEVVSKLEVDSKSDVKLLGDMVKGAQLLSFDAAALDRARQDVEERIVAEKTENDAKLDEATEAARKEALDTLTLVTEKTFLLGIKLSKFADPADPTTKLQIGSYVAEYFAWLLRCGRKADALAFLQTESEELERSTKRRGPLDLLATSVFYDTIAAAAFDNADDNELIRKMLDKVETALSREREVVGENPTIWERTGFLYDRMGSLYDDDAPEKSEYYDKALENYAKALKDGKPQTQMFIRFAHLFVNVLLNDFEGRGRACSKMYRIAEKAFENASKRRKRQIAPAFWDMTYAIKEWRERERHCFIASKRAIERLESLLEHFVKNPALYELKQVETYMLSANFWVRQNSWTRANDSLDKAIVILRKHLQAIESFDFPTIQESKEKALKDSRQQLSLALMLKAQLMTIQEAPSDPNGVGPALLATIEEAEKIVATFPVVNLEEFPRVTAFDKTKTFCKYWAETFWDILKAKFGAAISRFNKKDAQVDEEAEEPEEQDALEEANVAVSPMDQQVLMTSFMLRLFRILYDLDARPELDVKPALKKLYADVRLVYGKDSFVEILCVYYIGDAMLRKGRYTESIRAARYVKRQFPKNSLNVGVFVDNATPFLIDAYRILAQASMERRRPGDLVAARRFIAEALRGCRGAFLTRHFFMRSVYIEAQYVYARLELLCENFESALENARAVKRQLQIARRRGVTTSPAALDAEVEELIASAVVAIAERNEALKTLEGAEKSPDCVDKTPSRDHN